MANNHVLWVRIFVAAVLAAVVSPSAMGATARYEATLDFTWSEQTHPGAVPAGAHFSQPIGASHDENISFWLSGDLASPGIEAMSELGAITPLDGEIDAAIQAGTALEMFLGVGGITPYTNTTLVDVDDAHPLVTYVSMIAPSPDWFVGVNDLSLWDGSNWIPEVQVELVPWDAGTDDGTDFTSPNAEAIPHTAIHRLDAVIGSPFFQTPALGTLTFRLVPEPSGLAILAGLLMMSVLDRRPRSRR